MPNPVYKATKMQGKWFVLSVAGDSCDYVCEVEFHGWESKSAETAQLIADALNEYWEDKCEKGHKLYGDEKCRRCAVMQASMAQEQA